MGFRKGAYATVWGVEHRSDSLTKLRISIRRKEKDSENYVNDFSGFVSCVGTLAAKKAANLSERDRIRLGDVDVTNKYDKEKGVTYTNFTVFSFETQDEIDNSSYEGNSDETSVDDGDFADSKLPF